MKISPQPITSRRGFSLVEIIVAIGIAASTVTLMIGLLPAGLSTFRQAMNVTVTSQIGQRLLYEAAQTDYSVLIAAPATKPWRYFDDEGRELPNATNAIFHALVRVQPTTMIPTAMGGTAQPNLATVLVQVALNPENRDIALTGAAADASDPPEGTIPPDSKIEYTAFVGHVAKTL